MGMLQFVGRRVKPIWRKAPRDGTNLKMLQDSFSVTIGKLLQSQSSPFCVGKADVAGRHGDLRTVRGRFPVGTPTPTLAVPCNLADLPNWRLR